MGRKGNLEITRDKQSRKWVVNISPQLSKTGKRSRKKFATKVEAENYRKNLVEALGSKKLPEYDEDLLVTAHYYNEAFQLHGYKNLEEACDAWIKELESRNTSHTLGEFIKHYRVTRGNDWSAGSIQTFEWAKKQLTAFHDSLFSQLDAHQRQT